MQTKPIVSFWMAQFLSASMGPGSRQRARQSTKSHPRLPDQHRTAVDIENLSGDESSLRGAEEQNRGGKFLAKTSPARNAPSGILARTTSRVLGSLKVEADISVATHPGATQFT